MTVPIISSFGVLHWTASELPAVIANAMVVVSELNNSTEDCTAIQHPGYTATWRLHICGLSSWSRRSCLLCNNGIPLSTEMAVAFLINPFLKATIEISTLIYQNINKVIIFITKCAWRATNSLNIDKPMYNKKQIWLILWYDVTILLCEFTDEHIQKLTVHIDWLGILSRL